LAEEVRKEQKKKNSFRMEPRRQAYATLEQRDIFIVGF
jgi:hypothetical protein